MRRGEWRIKGGGREGKLLQAQDERRWVGEETALQLSVA